MTGYEPRNPRLIQPRWTRARAASRAGFGGILTDLDEVRAQIAARVARVAEIDRRVALVQEDLHEHLGLEIRCSKNHSGGKVPKIGEVHQTRYGTFFNSTIPWARSDATTLRPWFEEEHLSKLFSDRPDELANDQSLRDAMDNLEWWRDRGPGDISWIGDRAGRATKIIEILDLPETTGRRSLWVRCPAHLADFQALDPTRLVEQLRQSS